ncbi:MAG: hemerythrin domain-containing protein [Labilithrix sp.]|nr:hemerythrin domain-containing protein [Labilithrix sp.]
MVPSTRRRASVVCEAEGRLLLVRLRDPVSGVEALYPPGGAIEPNEAPAETARRETLEETGVKVVVDAATELVDRYPFCWAGVDYDVTTHYFAATLDEPFTTALPQVVDASYNLGALWLASSEALEALAVHPAIASSVARVLGRARRAVWRTHPNASGPGGTLLAIHDQFRVAAERLVVMVARDEEPGWIARAFLPLAQTLHHHHHAEEAMLFPMVHRRTGVAPERLVTDHEALTAAIDAVGRSLASGSRDVLRSALASFDAILVAHLDREEALVMPVLLALEPAEAWALIHGA